MDNHRYWDEKLTLGALCELIDLAEEMTGKVLAYDESASYEKMADACRQMQQSETREAGLSTLRELLGEDPDGVGMLAVMLHCALESAECYRQKEIPDKIYVDTMKAFSRFVEEHMDSYGRYGFDRGFCTPRQISHKLFRLGELEYELCKWDGEDVISVHIPSDARLFPARLDASLTEAHAFVEKYYPQYTNCQYVCDSWLLAPALKKMLPADSNIIRFQNRFQIESVDENAPDVMEWVFKNAKCDLQDLPEDTSLQRNIKAALLKGEKIGIAFGVMKNS